MPEPITTQFEFLYWQRDRALAMVRELSPDEFVDPSTVAYRDLRSTLVHELDVERSWRLRLQGAPAEPDRVRSGIISGSPRNDSGQLRSTTYLGLLSRLTREPDDGTASAFERSFSFPCTTTRT